MPKPTPTHHHSAAAAAGPTLTTSVYQTHHGIFSLTWSRSSFRRRSLHLTHHPSSLSPPPPPLSLHLQISPFFFWNNSGSKIIGPGIRIFWDFSRARFGSRPEPESGFFVAAVVGGVMTVLAGDSDQEAYNKTKAQRGQKGQVLALRREHVSGKKIYSTTAQFGSEMKYISIDCRTGDDPRLYFSIDHKRVLQIKHLKWKFRGNERIEVDGIYIQISWDVYNWLFEDDDQEGYALFMFRFEKQGLIKGEYNDISNFRNNLFVESQKSCGLGFEKKKMKKRILRSARSASSSSLSSASSVCSSVMEWESVEENELKGPSDFSLLVYAWKS